MPYLLDYLGAQFASFEELPFNAVDAAALSQLCMVRGEGVVPGFRGSGVRAVLRGALDKPVCIRDFLRAELFADMFTGLDPANLKSNLFALAASPRFRAVTVRDYQSIFDEKLETQFAAMSFVCEKSFVYVGFRGTDTSIVGWREDFNMAYASPVPAQDYAARYLEAVASNPRLPQRIIVGGHSKGGNLAEYAVLKANPKVQQRISEVYVLDGPGFKAGTFSKSDYRPLAGKLRKVVPTETFFGILMESHAPLEVVPSRTHGLDQHSVFTWEVNDALSDFSYVSDLPQATHLMARSLREWLAQLDDEQKRHVVDALFRTLETAGAASTHDLFEPSLWVQAAKTLDGADRDVLLEAGQTFAKAAVTNLVGSKRK